MAYSGDEVVEYKLVKVMREILERDLITNIPTTDEARARRVVLGKYDGSADGITLSVHADHPLGFDKDRMNAMAERGSSRAERYRPGRYPMESIGGVRFRHIFGTVQIRSVLDGVDPADAIAILALVKTRIAHTINSDPELIGITDAFQYSIFEVETTDDYGYASGGSGIAVDAHWVDWIAHCVYPNRRQY